MTTTLYVPVHSSGQRALPHLYCTMAYAWILSQREPWSWHVETVSFEEQVDVKEEPVPAGVSFAGEGEI